MKEKILTLIGALMGGVIFLGAFIWIVKHIRIVVVCFIFLCGVLLAYELICLAKVGKE